MPHPFKILELLDAKDREGLEAFCREKHRTVDSLLDWIHAHGYPSAKRSAVYNWREKFTSEDRFRVCTEAARALIDAANSTGGVAIAEASTKQLQTMLFESMLRLQSRGAVDVEDLAKIATAHRHATATQRVVEDLREQMAARQKLAATEADKVAKAGGSGESVAAKVREILGIA